jgi:16S rRNA processing protein RimM
VSTPIVIGKIGAAYGIRGWLKVQSFTEEAAKILEYNPWYVTAEYARWETIEVEAGRSQGKALVVKFVGIETPEIARNLTGKEIAVQREQLKPLPDNEYYWADLEGLVVINQAGEILGQVEYLMATGSNDVLVIRDAAGKEHALPYLLETVVKKVDLNQRILHVDWNLL